MSINWGQGRKSDEIWRKFWFTKLLLLPLPLDRLVSFSFKCFHIFVFYFTVGRSSRQPPGGSRDPWLLEMILQFSSSHWTRLQRRVVQNSRSLLLNDIFIQPSFMCKPPGRAHVSQELRWITESFCLALKVTKITLKKKKTTTKSSHIVIIHQSPVLPLLLHDSISYSGVSEWPPIRLSSPPVISSWLTSAEPRGDAEKTPLNDVTPSKKKDWQRSPHSSSGSAVSASFSLHPSSAQPRPLHDESRTNLLTLILSPRLAQFYFSRRETAICGNLDRQLYLLFSFCGPIKGEQLLHQIIWKTI